MKKKINELRQSILIEVLLNKLLKQHKDLSKLNQTKVTLKELITKVTNVKTLLKNKKQT